MYQVCDINAHDYSSYKEAYVQCVCSILNTQENKVSYVIARYLSCSCFTM